MAIDLTVAVPEPGALPTVAEYVPTTGAAALVVPPVTAGEAVIAEAARLSAGHAAGPGPSLVDLRLTGSGLAVTACRTGILPSALLGPVRPWLTVHRAGITATGCTLGQALARAHLDRGDPPPTGGVVHVAVDGADLWSALLPLRELTDLGFTLAAAPGVRDLLRRHGMSAAAVENPDVVVDRAAVAELPALVLTIQALAATAESVPVGPRRVREDRHRVTGYAGTSLRSTP